MPLIYTTSCKMYALVASIPAYMDKYWRRPLEVQYHKAAYSDTLCGVSRIEAVIFLFLVERRTQGVVRFLLIMPPSNVCPQCDAVVLKVCKSCQHVFRAKRLIEHTLPGRAMK